MPLTKIGWIDLIYVTLLFRACYIGFKKGFFPEIFRVAGLWLGFVLSFNNYTMLSGLLANKTGWNHRGLELISFAGIFLLIILFFKVLSTVSFLLSEKENVSFFSRITGLGLASLRGLLFLSLLQFALVYCPIGYLSKNAKENSLIGGYISGLAPVLYRASMAIYPYRKIDTRLSVLLLR